MARATVEHGAGGSVPVADVIARAGVSSTVFHEHFHDREACLLAALELGVERAGRRMSTAYDAESRWLDAIKAGLAVALAFLEDEPDLGRLLIVHSLGGGEQILRRRAGVLAVLAGAVDRGRLELAGSRREPPPVIAEGVVGAVLAVLHNRLLSAADAGVSDLFGSLISIVVLPYLGAAAARRELGRPAPRPRTVRSIGAPGATSTFEPGVATRLTYRTMRVLGAIGEYPGASNREVADRAGIVDQGQVSKLLGRLHARGLIVKCAEGRTRGAPNAWQLSESGELVVSDAYAFAGAV
jgi:AcrR family transcriptional regulator